MRRRPLRAHAGRPDLGGKHAEAIIAALLVAELIGGVPWTTVTFADSAQDETAGVLAAVRQVL